MQLTGIKSDDPTWQSRVTFTVRHKRLLLCILDALLQAWKDASDIPHGCHRSLNNQRQE